MKADALFRMPLYVVVALWLLRRRAARRGLVFRETQAEPVNFGDELAIFEYIESLLGWNGSTRLDRALLWIVSGRRRDAARLAQFGWMVVGEIPFNLGKRRLDRKGAKENDHNR